MKWQDELLSYLENDKGYESIKKDLRPLTNKNDYTSIPICVLSHMYDKRRSKFIVDLVKELSESKEGLLRDTYVFVYSDQKDLYSFLDGLDRVKVVLIEKDDTNKSLTGKRNYVVNYASQKGWKDIFVIEDDTTKYFLPTKSMTSTGVPKNNKHQLSHQTSFIIWEYYIKTHDIKISAPLIESSFIWLNFDTLKDTVRRNYSCIQAIHLSVEAMDKNGIRYDENSGWDDFDMNLQMFLSGNFPTLVPMGYHTAALKSGISTMEADKLAERCNRSSNLFFKKWGDKLVRIEKKRGLVNARINWVKIKNALKSSNLEHVKKEFMPTNSPWWKK